MLHHRACLPVILSLAALSAADRQLFIDDHIIHSAANLRRVIHPVQKYADNPIRSP
jgi:hypothetical protein